MYINKNEQIRSLYSQYYQTDDFWKLGDAKGFSCPNQTVCKFNRDEEANWTCYTGDKETSIMIVAEAPSRGGGNGVHIAGIFSKVADKRLDKLRRFVEEELREKDEKPLTPYFTDLVKCGVASQKDKRTLYGRTEHCFNLFLWKEICIIKPKTILCIGEFSYSFLSSKKQLINDYLNKMGGRKEGVKLYKMIHYSSQAGLPLTTDEKNKVWALQIKKSFAEMRISELNYFK